MGTCGRIPKQHSIIGGGRRGRRQLLLLPVVVSIFLLSLSSCEALKSPTTGVATTITKRRTTTIVQPDATLVKKRGGDNTIEKSTAKATPSFYWGVFHNWLYFLSLGFNGVNIQFLVRSIVDGSPQATPSSESITLSGKVESVDRLLTFLGVGYLAALSDKYGRKPIMIWSAIGFMLTNLIQSSATGTNAIPALYLADFIDGCTSCMLPVCQAYVVDCSTKQQCATNLGIFQGLSAGGAFILAFPIGGMIGYKKGPRFALRIAAALQAINALVLLLLTPEAHSPHPDQKVDFTQANPISGLMRLFGKEALIRIGATAYFLANLARGSLDAQFVNYTNLRFGWTQAQSGPVLVLVGLMLAIVPRLLVPKLGLRHSIGVGIVVFTIGLIGAGLASTPALFVASIAIIAVGAVCLPTLQALLANLSNPEERGALLGAMGSVMELTGAIGSTMYAVILAKFNSDSAPFPLPGFHFLVGASLVAVAGALTLPGLQAHKDDDAFDMEVTTTTAPDLDF